MTIYAAGSQRDEADAEAARQLLAAHVPDLESGLCRVCLTTAPCTPANAAANRLVDLGRPVLPREPDQPRARRRDRWWRRRAPTVPRVLRPAPLLTFAWRLRLDPLGPEPRPEPRPMPRPARVGS